MLVEKRSPLCSLGRICIMHMNHTFVKIPQGGARNLTCKFHFQPTPCNLALFFTEARSPDARLVAL